jgi:hypothetical protein
MTFRVALSHPTGFAGNRGYASLPASTSPSMWRAGDQRSLRLALGTQWLVTAMRG